MPGPRWHRTLIALLAAALLLVGGVPAAAAQDDRQVAGVPDELWTSPTNPSGAGPSSDGDGWSIPLLLLALGVAYAAGLLAAYGPGLLPASGAAAWSGPRREPEPEPEPEPPPPKGTQECAIEEADDAFQVVTYDRRGRRRVVARSEPLPDPSAAPEVHRRLVGRLRAVGWEPRDERRFLRAPAGPGRPVRVAAVEARHSADESWFAAVGLSAYGDATLLGESPSFLLSEEADPARSIAAAAAHAALLGDLEADGWEPSGTLGPWYATTLGRRSTARS